MSQTYPRYGAPDFERRWQTRFPAQNRYSWELRPVTGLPVEESRVQFTSWEGASQAGKLALTQFLQRP